MFGRSLWEGSNFEMEDWEPSTVVDKFESEESPIGGVDTSGSTRPFSGSERLLFPKYVFTLVVMSVVSKRTSRDVIKCCCLNMSRGCNIFTLWPSSRSSFWYSSQTALVSAQHRWYMCNAKTSPDPSPDRQISGIWSFSSKISNRVLSPSRRIGLQMCSQVVYISTSDHNLSAIAASRSVQNIIHIYFLVIYLHHLLRVSKGIENDPILVNERSKFFINEYYLYVKRNLTNFWLFDSV